MKCISRSFWRQELARIRELEHNPTLRWEHAKDDSKAETERIEKYKGARRARYAAARAAILNKASMSDQLDSLTLHG